MLQKRKRIQPALNRAFRKFSIRATCDGPEANCVKRLPSNI
jgi:hypothetical protein